MTIDRTEFKRLTGHGNLIQMSVRVMSDQLTPVLAYRRLVARDDRIAPSFLFESVEQGGTVGRFSYVGAQPDIEVIAFGHDVTVVDHVRGKQRTFRHENPLLVPREISSGMSLPRSEAGSSSQPGFTGGWVGYAGYDTVRFLEPDKVPFDHAPKDDRRLPDLHFALYTKVGVFDHVDKVLHCVTHVRVDEFDSVDAAYDAGCETLEGFVERVDEHTVQLAAGRVDLDTSEHPSSITNGNTSREGFEQAVERSKEYIAAGDIFQVVLSQRLERTTTVDPFDIYRALRIVNPSPYMIYLQSRDVILAASSPEILCRTRSGVVTNRPLAGTRPRGGTSEDDALLEQELLADEKERAEHIMLVDLGRNDLGRVCEFNSIRLDRVMDVERYSHVMHLSSTITGRLRDDVDCWDALRMTLPVGTVSGAPKIRAMQIIDELEPTRRGPYAGGIGAVSFDGDMDIALALRTIIIPERLRSDNAWTVHLQAGAGIVADSDPSREYEETQNKAAALGRAIDLAEVAFGG